MNPSFTEIQTKLDRFIANAGGELKQCLELQGRAANVIDQFSTRLAAVEEKATGRSFGPSESFGAVAAKAIQGALEGVKAHGRGRVDLDVKSFLGLTAGSPVENLYSAQQSPQIGTYGGFGYGQVRRLFRAVPADTAAVFQVRETATDGWVATGQTEGDAKSESSATLTGETLGIKTIATWIPISKQAMADIAGVEAFVTGRLVWALEKEIESQILTGSGIGEDLVGLSSIAAAFDTSLLSTSAGWDLYGVLGAAAAQVRIAGFAPGFIVLHPADAYQLRFARDKEERYLIAPTIPPVIETPAMTRGFFLTGDASQAVLRVRQDMTLDLSEEHGDYFVKNLLALRCEARMALQTLSRQAFVHGALASSPE